jgi:putative transposase
VKTPRDRKGSFEPKLVAKRQTRLAGLDERILSFYIGGMSVRDIAQHLSDLYGREIGRDTISRVTNAVLEDLEAWRTTPLEAVYPIAYFDCLMAKVREDRSVRTRACYLAVGVTVDGERDVLGIWWQETESGKLRLAVLNDLHQRGVKDVMICCVDGLAGFPRRSRRLPAGMGTDLHRPPDPNVDALRRLQGPQGHRTRPQACLPGRQPRRRPGGDRGVR